MADITGGMAYPQNKKSRVSKYPHGTPRNPERLREIARLRDEEKLQWRTIGPIVGMSAQGACLIYNHWKKTGWLKTNVSVKLT
jgi:hypothetical protein